MKVVLQSLSFLPAVCWLGACFSLAAPAEELFVPGDHDTIQEAIDAAAATDVITVGPGNYLENLDFLGKAIHVRSSDGPMVTTIDGGQLNAVVTFASGEEVDSVLDGFTLTNGAGSGPGDAGGAIYCSSASPTIANNKIIGNAAAYGGGIFVFGGSPRIQNNILAGNTATDVSSGGGGGAFYGSFAGGDLIGNTITGNSAAQEGGAIRTYCTSLLLQNNIIWGNEAMTEPSIYVELGSPVASYNLIEGGWPGTENIDEDPLFVPGPLGDYYLSQLVAGQPEQSPGVDTGDPAVAVDGGSTRTDEVADGGVVDMGFHYAGIPGGPSFARGDCDGDGGTSVVDPITLQNYLFASFPAPPCLDACDFTDDGSLNLADVIQVLLFLFVTGPPPAFPYPDCGMDPTDDALSCDLTVCP